MILNLGIGLLTPAVGPSMVVGCAIGRVSMEAVSRSILIFYVPVLIVWRCHLSAGADLVAALGDAQIAEPRYCPALAQRHNLALGRDRVRPCPLGHARLLDWWP
jgi:hypothetical protein